MSNRDCVPTVYLSGGLGNQLFQIASGLQFKSKKIVINTSQINGKFDLSGFLQFIAKKHSLQVVEESTSPSSLFVKAHNFALRSTQWVGKSAVQNFMVKCLARGFYCFCTLSLRGLYTNQVNFDKFVSKHSKFDVVGYFQTEKVAEVIKNELRDYLDFHFRGQSDASEKNLENVLMLHIRRGDYVSENRIGMLSLDYFDSALTEILKTHSISKLNFFSNGDLRPTVFNSTATVQEISQPVTHTALELLAKMRSGRFFLISNSTLSWWAAYLSTNSEKQVFAPTPWFRTLPEPVNLIPKGWIRLPAIWSQGNET
jgi:hypothetical protein